MARTINGFGSTFYGKRDFWPNGSYVMTEWVVFGYIPLFPTRSFRALPTDSRNYVFYTSESYVTLELESVSTPQVLSVYGYTLGMISLFSIWASLADSQTQMSFLVLLAITIPAVLAPFILRWRVRRGRRPISWAIFGEPGPEGEIYKPTSGKGLAGVCIRCGATALSKDVPDPAKPFVCHSCGRQSIALNGAQEYLYVCGSCQTRSILDEGELKAGAFKCPSCGRKMDILPGSVIIRPKD